ncbi:hypothetical protein BDD12DRAFT_881328 [Trichophaea hybrida]|nr:hypothetical protein BDD12DRAFT_881328 [Trichophaea hybrida]
MPRTGNKGLQQTLSTVVSSAFETPEILSVSPPPPDVSTPPRWGTSSEGSSTSTFASVLEGSSKSTFASPSSEGSTFASAFPPKTPSSTDFTILKEQLDKFDGMLQKLQKLDSYKEKFDLFEKRVKQQHDNMRDCFLQLQNNFFKKLENDEEATTRLQENDKSLREQIARDKFKLQEEIGSLKNQVEELKTTVGSLLEEKRAMGEELEKLLVPLATQVLKRNLARKQEESRKKAEPTMTKGQVEGRPSKTPRLVSPPKSLMHSKHATGAVEDRKRKREDGRAQAPKSEERKMSNDGRAPALKSEEKKKSETGWTEVKRRRRPRGPGTKIEDSRGYTLVWDTPTGRYESWRPKGSHEI